MAGLYAPLSTLRSHPRGGLRTDRGRRGLLFLHRSGLSPHTPCRSPGALTLAGARVVARHPKRPFFRRWDQGFESSFLQRRGCISREQQVCTRKIPRLRANLYQTACRRAGSVGECVCRSCARRYWPPSALSFRARRTVGLSCGQIKRRRVWSSPRGSSKRHPPQTSPRCRPDRH